MPYRMNGPRVMFRSEVIEEWARRGDFLNPVPRKRGHAAKDAGAAGLPP